jgi:hypothetical protein
VLRPSTLLVAATAYPDWYCGLGSLNPQF